MEVNEVLDPFDQMLAAVFTPDRVRAIEAGQSAIEAWDELGASGFLDALVPECSGGVELDLPVVGALWQSLGRHAVPLPVADTMVARAVLSSEEITVPSGPIALAFLAPGIEGVVSFGGVAEHILVDTGEFIQLVAVGDCRSQPTGIRGDVDARLCLSGAEAGRRIQRVGDGLLPALALTRAALIAGASMRLLEMSVAYANERVQFGKPIGRQQVLQQNLAMMAEDCVASRISVEMACAGGFPIAEKGAATAKSVASTMAPRISNTAHAIHGAIGISEEHDLQLFTRRLHAWRLAGGAEGFWNARLGKQMLEETLTTLDWARHLAR